ncbi:MAG: DUF4136 domain-containing protein [Pseudomonadota bacterium]|nr:DUF4136 domain-containing protein [Pseudomonadota bacterium]
MRKMKLAVVAMLGAATLGLSACETGFPAQVSRFQIMPAPAGQSFYVVPMDPRLNGSLEFQRFGGFVAQAMAAQGYAPAANPQSASLLVHMGYGVDRGRVEYQSDPFAYNHFGYGRFGGFGGGFGFGRGFYYPRFGGYRSAFYYGWDDPFWAGSGITSYTIYKSNLDLDIRRRGDNQSVFEGHAKARSESDDLNRLVPNLVEAMFTGFPGRNGETVKITVPPPGRVPPRG